MDRIATQDRRGAFTLLGTYSLFVNIKEFKMVKRKDVDIFRRPDLYITEIILYFQLQASFILLKLIGMDLRSLI